MEVILEGFYFFTPFFSVIVSYNTKKAQSQVNFYLQFFVCNSLMEVILGEVFKKMEVILGVLGSYIRVHGSYIRGI